MHPITLYVGDVEVLASQTAIGQIGVGRNELARQLEANLITALTRFDQVAGVVQAENVNDTDVGRSAPIRVSAALMDLSFTPEAERNGSEASTATETDEPATAQGEGVVECRVRLSFQMRTESGLMEFAAPQAYGRHKVAFPVVLESTGALEQSTMVQDTVPDVVLLGMLGAIVQAIPQIEQLYATEIEAGRRAAE